MQVIIFKRTLKKLADTLVIFDRRRGRCGRSNRWSGIIHTRKEGHVRPAELPCNVFQAKHLAQLQLCTSAAVQVRKCGAHLNFCQGADVADAQEAAQRRRVQTLEIHPATITVAATVLYFFEAFAWMIVGFFVGMVSTAMCLYIIAVFESTGEKDTFFQRKRAKKTKGTR